MKSPLNFRKPFSPSVRLVEYLNCMENHRIEVLMRCIAVLALLLVAVLPALAQQDQFPLVAKIISSDTERVASGASTSHTTAMPGTIWQHPQSNSTVNYRDVITVTAEIGDRIYRLRPAGWRQERLLNLDTCPARIDKGTAWLLIKDKNGKPKARKFFIASVETKR